MRVHFAPFDAAGAYVYTLDPTLPGATTATNPFQFNDVVDFSSFNLRKGDRIRVEYTRRSGSASETDILAAIRDVRIRVDINGVPIRADAYDTGPVQSRPLRDIVSHDTTEEVAVAYLGAVADWNHNEVVSPLRYPQGSGVGDGWEIQESSRGAGGAGAGEREIKILTEGLYDVDFRGGMRFQDRTTGQSQADDVVMEMLHIPAAHASDKNRYPSNNDLTVLSQKRVYDIARSRGRCSVRAEWHGDVALPGSDRPDRLGRPRRPPVRPVLEHRDSQSPRQYAAAADTSTARLLPLPDHL